MVVKIWSQGKPLTCFPAVNSWQQVKVLEVGAESRFFCLCHFRSSVSQSFLFHLPVVLKQKHARKTQVTANHTERQSPQHMETEKGKTDHKCHSKLENQIYQHLFIWRQQKLQVVMVMCGIYFKLIQKGPERQAFSDRPLLCLGPPCVSTEKPRPALISSAWSFSWWALRLLSICSRFG